MTARSHAATPTGASRPHSYRVLGIRVDAVTPSATRDIIERSINTQAKTYLVFSTVSSILCARDDEHVRAAVEGAGVVTPDGMPLVWLGRRRAAEPVERVYGPDFLVDFIAATGGQYTHFFYGGAPGVAATMAEQLGKRFPQLRVAGSLSPALVHDVGELQGDIEKINAARPDVVWVGLGHPKQELWMQTHRAALDASVLAGVGAAFDFLSGRKKEAPGWIKRSGLQWLHRLASEPRRLWRRYLVGNSKFVMLVARESLRGLS